MPVLTIDPDRARKALRDAGATITDGNTVHEHWRATLGDATAIGYDGKVVIQGRVPADIQAVLTEQAGSATVYFDGASRGNPGPAAIGWVLTTDEGILTEGNDTIGHATNNQAEYQALLRALSTAADYGFDRITIHGDSELVLKQLTGEYDVTDPTLQEYRVQAREQLTAFDAWTTAHVPREANKRADRLANDAL